MKRPVLLITTAMLAGLAAAPLASAHDMTVAAATTATTPASAKLVATRDALRKLWNGHVVAVRKVVVAAIAKKSAAETAAEKEVVDNAHAIAGAIEPYYGPAARDQLFTLLAGHYGAVKSYLEASLANDKTKQSKATDDITSNADTIATFLSGANPNWTKDGLLELLQVHGSHHISQIQQLIAKDSKGEAETWKSMTAHMNVLANTLAEGLGKQFPAKF